MGTEPAAGTRSPWAALYLLLTVLLLLTVAAGELGLRIRGYGFSWSKSLAFQAWLAGTLVILWLARRRRVTPWAILPADSYWHPLVPALAVLLFVGSRVRWDGWFFFLDPWTIVWTVALAPVFAVLFEAVERRRLGKWVYPALLVAAQLYLAATLLHTTGGAPIYRDDHPSFLYRFWILTETFPKIFFYNPLWNGGYVGTELISTGVLSLGLPALPVFLLFGVERSYVPILAGIFLVVFPWVTWLSCRFLGVSRLGALAAALLTVGTNRFFFVNLLTYGTTPSLFVAFLMTVVWALLYGAVRLGRLGVGQWLALVVSVNLMAFWPPSVLILLPVALAFLADAGSLNRRTVVFLLTAGGVLLLANAWWILEYLRQPRVVAFLTHESSWDIGLTRSMKSLTGALKQTNPMILAAGLLGVVWPRRRGDLKWLVPTVTVLLLYVAAGLQVKPHLQLHRMVIPLAFFLALVAGTVVGRLAGRGTLPSAVFSGVTGAVLFLTVLNVGALFRNRGKEIFWTMSREMRDLSSWLSENVPEEGRVFFAGRTVHGYGGGHVAYLQSQSGRAMIAGDYYHFDPQIVDYNPVPGAFRGSMVKVRKYFELMGVTHVVTYHENWKQILRKRRYYAFQEAFGEKEIYRTGVEPGFLVGGRGTVRPEVNRISVALAEPREEVVLRFSWLEGLRADPPVELHPVPVADGVTFIGATTNGRTDFVIRHGR